MIIFFSPTLGCFGDETTHGSPTMRPYPTPEQVEAGVDPEPIDNPSCRIPEDAVFVTAEQRDQLLIEQGQGKILRVVEGEVVAEDPPTPRPDEQMMLIRDQRNRMLRGTDYIVAVPDFAISAERRAELVAWRALLRDLPETVNPDEPFATVEWPSRPAWLGSNYQVSVSESS